MSSLSSVSGLGSSLSATGLVTGLDSEKIITGLLAVRQSQIDRLKSRQDQFTQQQGSYKLLQARLLSLQASGAALAKTYNGPFDGRSVASDNDTLAKAAASASAAPGAYTLRVNSVARAGQAGAQGFDGLTSKVTHGTLTVGSGTQSAAITIDATNDTLQGLAGAINAAAAGVTASIVNDGRAHPYRLILSAAKTGVANAVTVTNGLGADDAAGGAVKPIFDANAVGKAVAAANNTGTAVATAGGAYAGTTNGTYTFTVTAGGTVGTTGGITLAYADAAGAHTGTITLGAADADVFKAVAEGVQVKFAAGSLAVGDKFTVDTTVPTVQAAADASVTLGSGAGAVVVTSATNTLDGLINGVTINLQGADPTKDVHLTVSNDTGQAKQAVQDFVKSYNDVLGFIDSQIGYDPQTRRAGALLGDPSVTSIEDQLRAVVTDTVAGANPKLNRLSQVGATTTDNGQLLLNASRLDDVLNGRVAGVTADDVRRLFAFTGQSDNPGVQFVTGSKATRASTTPYGIDVTQAAKQAILTASADLAASTVLDNTNNSFTITLNGQISNTIALGAGAYTRQALVQALQSAINADTKLAGRAATVGLNGNKLVINSALYGAGSGVSLGPAAALGFTTAASAVGQDVAGSFLVNGVREQAAGVGQILTGKTGNANTDGLQVRSILVDGQVVAGSEANLTVARGLASRLSGVLDNLLDPVSGRLKGIDQSYQGRIDDLQKSITRQTDDLQGQRDVLVKRFVALETTVAQLKSAGDFVTSQFNALKSTSRN